MTQDQLATYRAALKEARESFKRGTTRLGQIQGELQKLTDEIRRLRRTITALAAMCSEKPGVDPLGITDACIEAISDIPVTVSTSDIVKWVESMGFDVAAQKNANASVHAVLTRLAKEGKITKVTEGETVGWRGPEYDKEFEDSLSAETP